MSANDNGPPQLTFIYDIKTDRYCFVARGRKLLVPDDMMRGLLNLVDKRPFVELTQDPKHPVELLTEHDK